MINTRENKYKKLKIIEKKLVQLTNKKQFRESVYLFLKKYGKFK